MARGTTDIYRDVEKTDDVRAINRRIRAEMKSARSRPALTELKKRSDYLCALAVSPSWRKRFGAGSERMLRTAMDEDRSTTAFANRVARAHGWEADYDAWGGNRNQGAVKRRMPRSTHKPAYHPSQSRYTGGGKVTYLVYRSPGGTRGRAARSRTRVRRLYLPGTARDVKLDEPKNTATPHRHHNIRRDAALSLARAADSRPSRSHALRAPRAMVGTPARRRSAAQRNGGQAHEQASEIGSRQRPVRHCC